MNEVIIYVLNSAVWSAGGLIVGFFLGRTGREVHEIKENLKECDDDT